MAERDPITPRKPQREPSTARSPPTARSPSTARSPPTARSAPSKKSKLAKSQSFFVDPLVIAEQDERERQIQKQKKREERRKQREAEEEEERRLEAERRRIEEENRDPNEGFSKYEAPLHRGMTASHDNHSRSPYDRVMSRSVYWSTEEEPDHVPEGRQRVKYTKCINISDTKGSKLRDAMRTKSGDELYDFITTNMTVDDLAGLSSKELRGAYPLNVLKVLRRVCSDCGISPPSWVVPFSEKEIIDEAN